MDTYEFIRIIFDFVEKDKRRIECENTLFENDFILTPTHTGSSIIQHKFIPIRGELLYGTMSNILKKIILETDKTVFNEMKSYVKSLSNFKYKSLFNTAVDPNTGVCIMFSNNIFEGIKITIYKLNN